MFWKKREPFRFLFFFVCHMAFNSIGDNKITNRNSEMIRKNLHQDRRFQWNISSLAFNHHPWLGICVEDQYIKAFHQVSETQSFFNGYRMRRNSYYPGHPVDEILSHPFFRLKGNPFLTNSIKNFWLPPLLADLEIRCGKLQVDHACKVISNFEEEQLEI